MSEQATIKLGELRERTHEVEWTHPQVQNNILAFVLGSLLQGETGEGAIAEALGIDLVSLRGLMEARYGQGRQLVEGDEVFIRRVLGGDFDDLCTILEMTRQQVAETRKQQVEG